MVDLAEISGQKAAATKRAQSSTENRLDRDAFMKLFLEQLKNQDPTAPMETDKIITQTAQLTQVEMQEESKRTMHDVKAAMESTKETNAALMAFQGDLKNLLEKIGAGVEQNTASNSALSHVNSLGALKMIGKIAETSQNTMDFDGDRAEFSLYFERPINAAQGEPQILIYDEKNALLQKISLKNHDGAQGYVDFSWDGEDLHGRRAMPGKISIKAIYNGENETHLGAGEVQSVVFEHGAARLKMGKMTSELGAVTEFREKNSPDPEKS